MKKILLIKPLISEKSTKGVEKNKYTFFVDLKVNKIQIKNEVEKKYSIAVEEVNTIICASKHKKRHSKKGTNKFKTSKCKKAMVKLKEGNSIDIYTN